ncbi:MAG TPA: dihydrofolate reductase [Candidatus Nanoarchaeia archaeon]|nr:dihydrofolate reductase [Candidatus Nanoarchaeia archaeon]
MEDKPKINIIAALTENNVIGKDNDMPWDIPGDLDRFRGLTSFKPVIMGKNTYLSLPVVNLPKRKNIVLSNSLEKELDPYNRNFDKKPISGGKFIPLKYNLETKKKAGIYVTDSLENSLEIANTKKPNSKIDNSEVYIMGGNKVYESFLSQADRLELTLIHSKKQGDTYFPKIDSNEWKEVSKKGPFQDKEGTGEKYSFVSYERR